MDIFEAIAHRHSYRGAFRTEAVPRENLKRIVAAGLLAPSGKNAQTTQFVIVDDPDLLRHIGSMHTMKAMQTARAMIVCVLDEKPEAVYEGFSFQVEDCAVAVQNMLLALTALGYAAAWIDGWLRLENRAQEIGKILGLPPGKKARILIPLGVPAEAVVAKDKKPFDLRACFNRYTLPS